MRNELSSLTPMPAPWRDHLRTAIAKRAALLSNSPTEACRVVHGSGDNLPGLFVDRLGQGATLIRHLGQATSDADPRDIATELLRALAPFGVSAIYDKPFVQDRSRLGRERDSALTDPTPLVGTPLPPSIVIREHDRRFEIRLYDGFSVGLFLDQRINRSFLANDCRGLRVLNTFAYTGGFSVACALAGATTTSVDISPRYLDWAKRNFALNNLDPADHHFARMDTLDFLRMAKRQGRTWDLIILDPPTFAAGNKRRGIRPWNVVRDYPALVVAAAALAPCGRIFASTNAADLCNPARFRSLIREALTAEPRWIKSPAPPPDFPTGRDCATTLMFSP